MDESVIDLQKGLPDLPEGLVEPAEVVGTGVSLMMGAATVLLAAGLVVLAVRQVRRRGARQPELPPRREAEEALQGLQRAVEGLSGGELAVELSAVVRRYVDRVWQTELSRQTPDEHRAVDGRGLAALPPEAGQRLGQFLGDCDALKFRAVEMSPRQKEELWRRAGDLVAWLPVQAGQAQPQTPAAASK